MSEDLKIGQIYAFRDFEKDDKEKHVLCIGNKEKYKIAYRGRKGSVLDKFVTTITFSQGDFITDGKYISPIVGFPLLTNAIEIYVPGSDSEDGGKKGQFRTEILSKLEEAGL